MFIQKYIYRTNNGEVGKEYRIGEFPVYLKERGVTQILPGIGKTTRHSEIAAYLKINRKDQYSIFCLQEWIETFHRLNYDCFIVCDNPALYKILEKEVVFPSRRFQIIKSQTRVFNSLLRKMISKCWLKAGIAHFTTFSHAEKKGYTFFWNVDADDTAFCCNVEERCELLRMAEEYARRNDLDAFSYDMWWTRSVGTHWSFGITFTKTMNKFKSWIKFYANNDWQKYYKKYNVQYNVDWFFTFAKEKGILKCGTFYAEELILIHWGDFFRNNFASNISYFKDEHLHDLLHERLFNSQSQTWKIPGSIPCIIRLNSLNDSVSYLRNVVGLVNKG